MRTVSVAQSLTAAAALAALAACSTWQQMDKTEGAVAGGVGGAVAGAVVGGPVGAVVGGVGGAYAGHEVAGKDRDTTTHGPTPASSDNAAMVRDVQQALNARGYDAGPADGHYGPSTRDALRRFQEASGLPRTGELDRPTLAALGVRG